MDTLIKVYASSLATRQEILLVERMSLHALPTVECLFEEHGTWHMEDYAMISSDAELATFITETIAWYNRRKVGKAYSIECVASGIVCSRDKTRKLEDALNLAKSYKGCYTNIPAPRVSVPYETVNVYWYGRLLETFNF